MRDRGRPRYAFRDHQGAAIMAVGICWRGSSTASVTPFLAVPIVACHAL
jgi:hypothetical protein